LERFGAVAASHVGDDTVPGLVALVAPGDEVHVESLGTLAVGERPVERAACRVDPAAAHRPARRDEGPRAGGQPAARADRHRPPDDVRDKLRHLPAARRIEVAARPRPGQLTDQAAAAKLALASVAKRIQHLHAEIIRARHPTHRAGGRGGAAAAGPTRGRRGDRRCAAGGGGGISRRGWPTSVSFADLCGTSPVEVSSG